MRDAFTPMPPEQQARFQSAYLSYLRARDGVPDLAARRFDVRERFFAEIDAAPVRWQGKLPIDPEVFHKNHLADAPAPGLDPATLWALATAKTNRSERFGVELSIENPRRHDARLEDPHTFIQIEEFYHTRILKDALATLGLDVEVSEPPARTKLLVKLMVYLPEGLSDIAVLCGEIVGVVIFSLLLEKARALFSAQPEALARVEALFAQILVDEVGHVHYLRSRVSPTQLTLARWMLPIVVGSVLSDIPELGLLFGPDELLRRAREADVDAAASAYADRLVLEAA
ncbi:MAG: hypothetical protein RIT28_974 [Pseudomonadota bacterium]